MKRREILRSLLGLWPAARLASAQTPTGATWTSSERWRALQKQLGARVVALASPLEACARANGAGAETLFARLKNPYYLGDEPALTQTLGWTGAWVSRASRFAVRAESADDVAAAVRFARAKRRAARREGRWPQLFRQLQCRGLAAGVDARDGSHRGARCLRATWCSRWHVDT